MSMTTTYDTPLLTALEQLGPHDHQSLIYDTAKDRFEVAIPFIRIGLDRGEKCIYIADDGMAEGIRSAMRAQGIDVAQALASQRLVLATKEDAFLRDGAFDADRMPTFWMEAAAEAARQGFAALRATGETEWLSSDPPGSERWMEYESRLTDVLADLKCFALCQYNRERLPPEFILNVIRTHPTVIYRGIVCRNLYHVPPGEFLATDQSAREVERLLTTIRERAEIEHTLRGQRNELRTLANRLMHAQDDERRRIAAMLHETTAQDLVALKMLLARLNRTAEGLNAGEREVLGETVALAEQAMGDIRTVSYLLHPPFLDEAGLLSALRWYARGFAERSGIKVELDLPDPFERLPLDTETVLFRVVQESLTNIHRHARSKTARIRVQRDAETLVLAVQDAGTGIPSYVLKHIANGGAGVGIAGMTERIQQLGGRFELLSGDGGTTVRVSLPLPTDAVP